MLASKERHLQDTFASEGSLVFIRHHGRNRDSAGDAGNAEPADPAVWTGPMNRTPG